MKNTLLESSHNYIKQKQLRSHKLWATGLFVLMVLIYISCVVIAQKFSFQWIGFVKAFSEAAMVGALADWFAVTALFHHPLGLKIPHTNLIESKKQNIGDNLGDFVVQNFLNPATIRPYFEKLKVSPFVIKWLIQDKNRNTLSTELTKLMHDFIKNLDAEFISKIMASKGKDLLNTLPLNETAGNAIDIMMQQGYHHKITDYLANKIHLYLDQNKSMIKERVKEESHFLIPGFVDNIIADKLTEGFGNFLNEIEKNKNHPIRADINKQLEIFANDLKSNPDWQLEFQKIKDNLLSENQLNLIAKEIWNRLQSSMVTDLESNDSSIKKYLTKLIADMANTLQNDSAIQNKIDTWVRFNAYKYAIMNSSKIGELISTTVGNWKGKDLSNKLELEVGKDLQFIRINGTIVGGLVGLLIYTITQILSR